MKRFLFLSIILVLCCSVFSAANVFAETKTFYDKKPGAQTAKTPTAPPSADLMPIEKATSSVAVQPTSEIRVQLVPKTQSLLSSQILGQIQSIEVEEGDEFKKGDVLVRFDCAVLKAEQRKASAELSGARTRFKANKDLSELNSGSVVDLEVSRSEMARAEANLDSFNKQVSDCTVIAPYDGYVVRIFANPFETVPQNKELMLIIDNQKVELEVIVPSKWYSKLKIGGKFNVSIDETGKTYPAMIKKIGAKVDAVSQSINVYGEIVGDFPELKAGMSGQSSF